MSAQISVVLPARNESAPIGGVVMQIRALLPEAEVIVVDDGSSDSTDEAASKAGARVVRHPYSKGNGAAIKSGARAATGDVIVFMDAIGARAYCREMSAVVGCARQSGG